MLTGERVRLGDVMIKLSIITTDEQNKILQIQNRVKSPVPGYEIIEKLGQGGMGAVYKARQINMDRLVAIKILNPQLAADKSYIDRFLKEARSVARLSHNNIIRGIDVGQHQKRYYFVMEFVDGMTLQEKLNKEGAFTESEAIEFTLQISSAIQYISQFHIVHRDIKPDNIILNSRNVPKLADLGLALTTDGGSQSHHQTKKGNTTSADSTGFVGTPHYISPEQAQDKKVDIRSDIYSLGATLFHMVSGRTPFVGERSIVIMTKHITEDVEDPKILVPELTDGIRDVILKMMEKDPGERYQTPNELIDDLNLVKETGRVKKPRKTRARRPRRKPTSSPGRGRRRRRKTRASTRRSRTSQKGPGVSDISPLSISTDSFPAVTDEEINARDNNSIEEMLKMAKETKDFSRKEYFLKKILENGDVDDEIALEARCRFAYLISVLRKDESIDVLLEIIEDYIEYSDNKFYKLAESKLTELNRG